MSDSFLLKLGQEIEKRYKDKFNSKLEFSYACDVDEKTIRRLFLGKQNVSILILKKICDTLEIKISDVLISIEKNK
jgi:DNA-binding Xre family transcriptional regulator